MIQSLQTSEKFAEGDYYVIGNIVKVTNFDSQTYF
jgi:hypothetical protein